jgi:hypothetical protein
MITKIQNPPLTSNVFESGYGYNGQYITIVRRDAVRDILSNGYIIKVSRNLYLKNNNGVIVGAVTRDLDSYTGYWVEAIVWLAHLTRSIDILQYSQSIYKEVNGVYHEVTFSDSDTDYKSKLKVPKESA